MVPSSGRRIGYKITVCYMGEIERHYSDAVNYYVERLNNMCHFALKKIERIPARIYQDPHTYGIILLDESGKEMDSMEFCDMIRKLGAAGKEIVFIIGPAEGFRPEDKAGKRLISLSRLTFQNTLALLILLEQIYRSILTIKGVQYSK